MQTVPKLSILQESCYNACESKTCNKQSFQVDLSSGQRKTLKKKKKCGEVV